jgi:hypothetical protein
MGFKVSEFNEQVLLIKRLFARGIKLDLAFIHQEEMNDLLPLRASSGA